MPLYSFADWARVLADERRARDELYGPSQNVTASPINRPRDADTSEGTSHKELSHG